MLVTSVLDVPGVIFSTFWAAEHLVRHLQHARQEDQSASVARLASRRPWELPRPHPRYDEERWRGLGSSGGRALQVSRAGL